jgi:feruloyl esterase
LFGNRILSKPAPPPPTNLQLSPGRHRPGTSRFDALTALEQWVERNQPPEQIPAAHVTNGKVDRTRPLCPYPQEAKYKGSGSTDVAANFACEAP